MDDSFQNAAFLIATDENHGRTQEVVDQVELTTTI